MNAQMGRRALEPGLVTTVRLYMTLSAGVVPVASRLIGLTLGVDLPLGRYLVLLLPVPLLLVAYFWTPWPQRRLGPAFVPVGLGVYAANTLVEKTLTLQLLVPPEWREVV